MNGHRVLTAVSNLPLLGKLLFILLLPLSIMLAATVPMTISSLTRMEADTSSPRLRDEVGASSRSSQSWRSG